MLQLGTRRAEQTFTRRRKHQTPLAAKSRLTVSMAKDVKRTFTPVLRTASLVSATSFFLAPSSPPLSLSNGRDAIRGAHLEKPTKEHDVDPRVTEHGTPTIICSSSRCGRLAAKLEVPNQLGTGGGHSGLLQVRCTTAMVLMHMTGNTYWMVHFVHV